VNRLQALLRKLERLRIFAFSENSTSHRWNFPVPVVLLKRAKTAMFFLKNIAVFANFKFAALKINPFNTFTIVILIAQLTPVPIHARIPSYKTYPLGVLPILAAEIFTLCTCSG